MMPVKHQKITHSRTQSSGKGASTNQARLPHNWPSNVQYLYNCTVSSNITAETLISLHISLEKFQPSSYTPLVTIKIISSPPSHPAIGQCGLFASKHLEPGRFICDYLGHYHSLTPSDCDTESNYDLVLDREAGIGVDARFAGNEARMVNDYRGVGERPNVEFRERMTDKGEKRMALWVTKRAGWKGLRKGEELLVSYGKGFWKERMGGVKEEG